MTRYHYFINYSYCGNNIGSGSVIYISEDKLTYSRHFVNLCLDIDSFYSHTRTSISINSLSLLLTTDFESSDLLDKTFTKHIGDDITYTMEVIYSGYHLKNAIKDPQELSSKKLPWDVSEYLAPILGDKSPEDLSKFFKLLLSKSENKQIIYQNDLQGFQARNAIINYFESVDDGETENGKNESKEILIKNIIDSLVSLYEDFDLFSKGGELHTKYPNGMFIDSGIRMGIEMCFATIRSLFYGYSI